MPQSKRIGYMDFLKSIGLICVIIAHVNPPPFIMMLRGFDVPLMIILSALLAERSYNKRLVAGSSIKTYYVSRFMRLVTPTWIFLALFFVAYAIMSGKFESIEYYLYSFGLTRYGIGYVWIILIYLYCAILVPLFDKISFTPLNSIIIIICYILYEICFYYSIGTQNKLIMSTLYYIIPYGMLTYIGFHYNNMEKKHKYVVTCISGTIFLLLMIYYWISTGSLQLVSIAKYPPRIYFISYGVFCSFILLLFVERFPSKFFSCGFFRFISEHSLWIYLWHILVLTIYNVLHLPSVWFVKFTVVFLVSVLIAIVVSKIVGVIRTKHEYCFLKFFNG